MLRSLGGHFCDVENSEAYLFMARIELFNNYGRLTPVKTKTTTQAPKA